MNNGRSVPGLTTGLLVATVLGCLSISRPARAWLATGHAGIAEQAVRALPDSVPLFFREGFAEVGKSAMDPDFFRLRDLPQLRDGESPEHYLDVELLQGAQWPETRYRYHALLADREVSAFSAGMLPYSLAEGVQKLAASLAQVRLNSSDKWAQARALHHAGIMAHYAADLCQPLHTTIHYNGRARPDHSSPGTGIHFRTDSLAKTVLADGLPAPAVMKPAADLFEAIRLEFAASHALVDRVYELDAGLGPDEISVEAMAFARERIAASIRFTAEMFLIAWELSGEVDLPNWYRSSQSDGSSVSPGSSQ